MSDSLRSKPDFHADQIEQLAFELAFELEEADLSRDDLVTINRNKLKEIASRVISRSSDAKDETIRQLTDERAEQWRQRREAQGSRDAAKAACHSLRIERDQLRAAIHKAVDPSAFGIEGIESAEDHVKYMHGVLSPILNGGSDAP